MPNPMSISRRRFLKLSVDAAVLMIASACRDRVRPEAEEQPASTAAVVASPSAPTEVAPTVQPATPTSVGNLRVTLPGTEVFDLPSSMAGRDYRIYVALPADYAESTATYPVLFAGDANGSFGMVVEIARGLASASELPDLLVVGIGYPTDSPTTIGELRIRDFSPTAFNPGAEIPGQPSFAGSGGADIFQRFLCENLMPVIGAEYRVVPGDSAFLGHSLGGLFGLYTMFAYPDTFGRYIIGSPSIWWDNRAILRFEDNYAAEHTDLAARVYMAIGSLEGASSVANVLDLAEVLETRGYPSLTLETHVFEDETHISVLPATISRGLRSIYSAGADR